MIKIKVLVAGDWHGNLAWAKSVVDKAWANKCQVIMQCGDFGIWDHTYRGILYLDELNAHAASKPIHIVFTDGNHENHDRLEWYAKHNPKTDNKHTYIRSHIIHAPRGSYWTWNHKKFMTVGGAVSIDKDYRLTLEKRGDPKCWWPGEQLTGPQANGIVNNMEDRRKRGRRGIDYLFTHDCSDKTPFKNRLKPDFESKIHRQRMDDVIKAVRPKIHFHGHMHERYDWQNLAGGEWVQTYGLEMDGDRDNWGILDTTKDTFTFASDLFK